MNTAIKYDPINGIRVTDNDNVLTGVISSLVHNNTFYPNVTKCLSMKRQKRVYNKDTKKHDKVLKDVLVVSFADGTWVEVTRSDDDRDDPATAFLYALTKRMFGTPTPGGYVNGDGFMDKIKKFVASIKTEKDIEEEKNRKVREKEEADKKAHEEALRRHLKNPSLGYRLRSLEDKFDRLMDLLGDGNTPNKKSKGFRNFFNK